MIIYIKNNNFQYELEKLVRLFFPFEKITFAPLGALPGEGFFAVAAVEKTNGQSGLYAAVRQGDSFFEQRSSGEVTVPPGQTKEKEQERALALLLFYCLCSLTGYRPQWGILTGVRPAKLYHRLQKDLGQKAEQYLKTELAVSGQKLSLLRQTAALENKIIARSKRDSVSLYLSVPFCPTRCSYCSFVSHSIAQAKKLIPQYVTLLCREIEYTAGLVRQLGLKTQTVYMGGGTPTTLSAEQLKQVLSRTAQSFGGNFLEFTVEAGRPDTITKEKLLALKQSGVDRISINPQTMNNAVLQKIGRCHTAEQTVQAFYLAREVGFLHINMDLIAGLPGDDFHSFANTLKQVLALNPESVTVHTLAYKRAADLTVEAGVNTFFESAETVAKMVDYAREILGENGIFPYYMYRQSKTVGNLENVGYAKPGSEGLYNVFMMDETHSVLGCGASAVTKLRQPGGPQIERIFNFKYPYEYLTRFEEMLKRKQRVEAFYREYPY